MVNYTTRMPDIEDLMQVWPAEFEEALGQINLPPAELDAPLSQYAELLSLLLDIPVAGPPAKNAPAHARIPAAPGGKPSSTHVVEALHVMFSLYAEFNSSAHFKALERSVGS
ncbi:Intraflagellar transport protein 46 [Thoreauomyces humboldtii]|nr:Intraflagellar transport protein 46 [Thoreauomyces humboldtii]